MVKKRVEKWTVGRPRKDNIKEDFTNTQKQDLR